MGRLEKIWVKRAHRGKMDPASAGMLDAEKGLRDNANYGGRRQVTIIAAERWTELEDELEVEIDPSARRANLLVSGIDLENSRDRVLKVGTCLLKIGGETRPCERMDEAHEGLQEAMKRRWGGGAWAMVVEGGPIAVGDEVAWVSTP